MRIVKCVACGASFKTNKNAKKCCSDECSVLRKKETDRLKRERYKIEKSVVKECVVCGDSYPTLNKSQQFCSLKCSSGHYSNITYNKICEQCGKSFVGKINSKYCDNKCADHYYRDNPIHSLACRQCGRDYKTNYKNQQFCSYECANENNSIHPIVKCECCGSEFRSRPEFASRFCSRKCYVKQFGIKPWKIKKKLSNLTHIKRAKKYGVEFETINHIEVFEDNGWICQICNNPVNRTIPYPDLMSATLDHITPMSKGGPHTKGNVQLTHLGCNLRKGNSKDI